MALLLQCLRDVRTLSGDLDLLPPLERGDSLVVGRLRRNGGELGDASSRSEFGEACALPEGHTRRIARKVHRDGRILQPVVSASGRLTREPGSMSGTRCQQTDSPWPAAFPPPRHHFRPGLVRQLPRYYAAVRLPASVAHRCTPLGSMRPARHASQRAAEDRGTSRFPYEMFPHLRGVSDRAGSGAASSIRQLRCCLRLTSTASAPRTTRSSRRAAWITVLDARPARTPVNASPTPSRMCTHDSGPP